MRISDAELPIMEALWDQSPASSEELFSLIGEAQGWQYPTLRTLVNRLLTKGAIEAVKEGRRNVYKPIWSREDWVSQQSSHLLDRLFGGRLSALVSHFAQQQPLTAEDRKALSKLIGEKRDD